MSVAPAPYRSSLPAGRDGFLQLVHSEWTKFRTVRSWIIAAATGALLIVLIGVFTGAASHSEICIGSGGTPGSAPAHVSCRASHPNVPLGPGGEPVVDQFSFAYQRLTRHGSITARVTSLVGEYSTAGAVPRDNPTAGEVRGVQQWAKAGVIVKQDLTQGSPYAAVMLTGRHGVRMQYDYTHDLAGISGAVSVDSPRWLRLTRSGDTLTGYDSTDGRHWTTIGSARLPGLPGVVQVGLFATSPDTVVTSRHVGGGTASNGPSLATATFDHVTVRGAEPARTWRTAQVGNADSGPGAPGNGVGVRRSGGRFTVGGSGDIAAGGVDADQGVGRSLVGAFVGLIALIVMATLFITGEYKRGLIDITFSATPRRGRVLAAKALVIAAVSFVAGLVGCAIALPVGVHLLRSNGGYIAPAGTLTDVRVVAGTAALLAVAAVFALAIGTILRRSAGAVTLVIAAIVLPYLLAVASVLPTGAAQWLLRITPAAAFAIQQTVFPYPRVAGSYSPGNGYFPLAPWAGFAVLCGYAACALAVAIFLLNRRDV